MASWPRDLHRILSRVAAVCYDHKLWCSPAFWQRTLQSTSNAVSERWTAQRHCAPFPVASLRLTTTGFLRRSLGAPAGDF